MAFIQVERQPFCEPVSLSDMKDFLRVLDTNDDAIISGLIKAAREYCENFTGRSLINKGYLQVLDSFPYYTDTIMSQQAYPPSYYSLPRYSTSLWNYSQMIKLLRSPLADVDHITYWDSATGRPKALVLSYLPWFPLIDVPLGAKIVDSNGYVQNCTTAGKAGSVEPSWASGTGTTSDGSSLVWTNTGTLGTGSQFIIDSVSEPPRIFPKAGQYWPSVLYVPNAVEIHFTAGYNNDAAIKRAVDAWVAGQTDPAATAQATKDYEASLRRADLPETIKTAVYELVSHWWLHREAVTAENLTDAPKTVDMLLWTERVADLAPTRG